MRVFTGQYDRTIDAKNRIQLPSQLRAAMDGRGDGEESVGLYVTPGEFRHTLSIFTERGFESLCARIETETMVGDESRQFELQFYALASFVDMDKQGRLVLPDRLRRMARLGEEVCLVGQKFRIDIWDRRALDRSIGVDWEGNDWPEWRGFLRMKRPEASSQG